MNTDTSTIPTIRELTQEATREGFLESKDICAYITHQIRGYDQATLLDLITQMLPTVVPVLRANSRHTPTTPPVRRTQSYSRGASLARLAAQQWQQKKNDLLCVDGIIKRFGDCTRQDLFHYADYLDDTANAIHRNADYYRTIAGMLPEGETVDYFDTEIKVTA